MGCKANTKSFSDHCMCVPYVSVGVKTRQEKNRPYLLQQVRQYEMAVRSTGMGVCFDPSNPAPHLRLHPVTIGHSL